MANIHGKNGYLLVEDSGGTQRNWSADGNNMTLTESIENPTITGYGDVAVQRAGSGLQDVKLTYEGYWNDAAATNACSLSLTRGRIGLISIGPNGSVAGQVKYTACMILDDYEVGIPVAGIVTVRASWSLASGCMDKTTF